MIADLPLVNSSFDSISILWEPISDKLAFDQSIFEPCRVTNDFTAVDDWESIVKVKCSGLQKTLGVWLTFIKLKMSMKLLLELPTV